MSAVIQSFAYFTGLDGLALDNGSIYIGEAGQDARLYPVAAYRDAALTLPWAQPIRTVAGYPAYQGAPSQIYIADGACSVTVLDNDGTVVLNNAVGVASISAEALEGSGGSALVGFIQSGTGAVARTAQDKMRDLPLTPFDFGGVGDGVTDDTAAFAALSVQYGLGRSIHFPEGTWLFDADTAAFVPPASYNALAKRPPAITADKSCVLKARTGGNWLIRVGSLASDYSGYLRTGTFQFGLIDGDNKTFTKAPLYFPFFLDIYVDYTVRNAVRCAWFGDTAAPTASAGVKGRREYGRDLPLWARTVQSITNANNPVVTFAAPHGLWPSSGNRVVCINITGTLGSWAAIHNRTVDCTILSATQIQLLNVNSTAWGALPGAATAYLNFASSRIPKQISGVTNANPCVVTTAIPHLFTNGDTVDVAEIFSMPTLVGQYVATVLSPTTFSIPVDTTSTATWGAWGAFGPGWVEQWVPHNQCDIAEYHDNATDIDDSELFSVHYRIHQYHNPATCGWDGKHNGGHFYNFPEAGEMRCAYYLGGDNNMVQIQCDGPFRSVFWAFGPRNASTNCSTNMGYINPTDQYGVLVRTESGASWTSISDRLKSASSSFRAFSEHIGLGGFNLWGGQFVNVAAPQIELGARNVAATVQFDGATGAINTGLQVAAVTRSSAGIYVIDMARAVPLNCTLSFGIGASVGLVAYENTSYGSRSVTKREVRVVNLSGVATDPVTLSVTWRFP